MDLAPSGATTWILRRAGLRYGFGAERGCDLDLAYSGTATWTWRPSGLRHGHGARHGSDLAFFRTAEVRHEIVAERG